MKTITILLSRLVAPVISTSANACDGKRKGFIIGIILILLTLTLSGCTPRLDSADPAERRAAVAQITDQKILEKIAAEDKDSSIRVSAVERLIDQDVLSALALQDRDVGVRVAAVNRLTDQTLLAKIATEDLESVVRKAAIGKLKDQQLLMTLATSDKDLEIRETAFGRLQSPDDRIMAISSLGDSTPRMRKLAGDLKYGTTDVMASVARINLAIHESPIVSRLPRLRCIAKSRGTFQSYTEGNILGEKVAIELCQDGTTLAEGSWETDFPRVTSIHIKRITAEVHAEELLTRLFCLSVFTEDDLAKLVISSIPEVREGAVAKLSDQALLAKVAVEDENGGCRRAAIEKVTDQSVLSKVVIEDENWDCRRAAIEKLTDQSVLTKIAASDKVPDIREKAKSRLAELNR